MAVFAAVAETESFTRAAARLELSKAAVSKQVARLEARLGARLINRTTRRLSLTEAGLAYLAHCQRILAEAEAAEAAIGAHQAVPMGLLRISAPMSLGRSHIGPIAASFAAAHPAVSIDLGLDDRYVDVVAEGIDVAVRVGVLDDSSLIARRIATCERPVVAAPSYLAHAGRPRTLDDLAGHTCLHYSLQRTGDAWVFETPSGRRRVPLDSTFRANNGDVVLAASIAGLGLAVLPTFICGPALADGRLVAVPLENARCEPATIHAVYPTSRHLAPKVRAFVDRLAGDDGLRSLDCAAP
jgi:DNA-binding transcriptional LysR family regulator